MESPISAIILTYNEEKNIQVCLDSVKDFVQDIFIVDSFSTDETLSIAKKYTDKIFQHEFETHAKQWKWALKNLPVTSEWILAPDADQAISGELKNSLIDFFSAANDGISGLYFCRKQIFFNRWIKYGDYYPRYLLKVFKKDKVFIDENELADHHFYVQDKTLKLEGDLIEDNKKERDLSFWCMKHIKYAELLAKEELLYEEINLSFAPEKNTLDWKSHRSKRFYRCLPLFIRSILYFLYRYFIKLGFLDGKEGLIFHFLQGFWFRFLVDAKIYEMRKNLGIKI